MGRVRRDALDRLRRVTSADPLPPAPLLATIQPTAWIADYLDAGSRSAEAIRSAAARAGAEPTRPLRVLDFGCGPARILRHLRESSWRLHGCDTNAGAIAWCAASFPDLTFTESPSEPPLPFESSSFDLVLAISVFPHFSANELRLWRVELARILTPRGHLVLSSLGPWLVASFATEGGDAAARALRERGFFEARDPSGVTARIAFHTPAGLARLLAPEFEVLEWRERGLDGVQDLSVLRARVPAEARHR